MNSALTEGLEAARTELSEVLARWQEIGPKACLQVKATVDRSLVFYQEAKKD